MNRLLLVLAFLTSVAWGQAHHVDLTITDNFNPPTTKYNYYRADGDCPPVQPRTTTGFTKLNATPLGNTLTDTTVVGGKSYCYIATSFDGLSESQPSPVFSVIIPPFAAQLVAVAQ